MEHLPAIDGLRAQRARGLATQRKRMPALVRSLCAISLAIGCAGLARADAPGDYETGRRAFLGGDVMGAMEPLRRAADAGHADAQALLGYILDKAELDDEALIYLKKSAEQDNPDGLYGLAMMYAGGEGVAKDFDRASGLLRKAASLGHVQAKRALAAAYIEGNAELGAAAQDSEEARRYLLESAEGDFLPAVDALATAYASGGFGFTVDPAKAREWTNRGAELRRKTTEK